MSLAIANAERPENIQALIDKWLEQERNGVRFPVDFETAWYIAGYSRKDSAKRKLSKMTEGTDFHRLVEVKQRHQRGAVEVEVFTLTCDALKHFCLLAETEQGREIRQYFVECEKKWKLVEQHHPEIAQEINLELRKMEMQTEILKLQNDNLRLQGELRNIDSTMITLHGVELTLALRGKSDQLVRVETVVTEVVNPKTGNTDRILTAEQLKKIVKQNTGQTIPSMKWFTDKLREKGRDDLLVPVTRHQISEYVTPETLAEAIALVFGENRQLLLGE
jgi:phage anti-repressor protein